MTYEQMISVRLIHRLGGMNPEDKMRAANWILNDCDGNKSQLSEIAKLAEIYNRGRSPESKKSFIRRILNPEYVLREGAD